MQQKNESNAAETHERMMLVNKPVYEVRSDPHHSVAQQAAQQMMKGLGQGLEKGRRLGKAELLKDMAKRRFGELPSRTLVRRAPTSAPDLAFGAHGPARATS